MLQQMKYVFELSVMSNKIVKKLDFFFYDSPAWSLLVKLFYDELYWNISVFFMTILSFCMNYFILDFLFYQFLYLVVFSRL